MTHIAIPLAERTDNGSLEYALESIRRHTDYIPVIIGRNPGNNELHIPTHQGRDVFANTAEAMRVACTTDWISDPFIWSNDDIYWTRPATPIRWAIGQLDEDSRSNKYGQRKRLTVETLRRLGFPTYDYESHTPLPITKAQMLMALQLPGQMRSLFGNISGTPDLIAADVKMRTLTDAIVGPWVSTARNPDRYPNLWGAIAGGADGGYL